MKKDIKKSEQNKYQNILLTDVQFHTVKPTRPTPWLTVILKSLKSKKPGRFYTKNISFNKDGTFELTFSLPPETQKKIEEAKKSGKKIRLLVSKDGLFMFPGPDAIEKLKAEKKKRRPLTRVWRDSKIK